MFSLPGNVIKLSHNDEICEGYNCNCDNVATHRMQGETDSFGAEYMYYCKSCLAKCQEDIDKSEEDNCEWCHTKASLQPVRDFEEGLSGPVYYVCSSCAHKQNKRMQEELDWLDEN
ncbi:MAG: hypothetical protein ACXAAH_01585 [Promethearchaeota archaeon]|jgi:hypothetical protein